MRTGKDLQLAIDKAWDDETHIVPSSLLPPKTRIRVDETIVNPGVTVRGTRCGNLPRLQWRGKGDGPIMRLDFLTNAIDPYGHTAKNPLNWGLSIQDISFAGGRALESERGFKQGCSLERLFFWNCTGPVVQLQNCWEANIQGLEFYDCDGEVLVLENHHAGVLNRVLLGKTRGGETDRAAIILQGSCADWRGISAEGPNYPGKPTILIHDSRTSSLRNVRGEGGPNGQFSETMIRLKDCVGCRVETVDGGFQRGTDALSVVDVVGGRGNRVVNVTGAGWRRLRSEGAIVTYRQPGEVTVEQVCNLSEERPADTRRVVESAAGGIET